MTHDEYEHEEQEHEHAHAHHHRHHHGSTRSWLTGFLVGGLAGLAVSLLYAPQAGRDTRELVRYKATQLKQAAEQTAQETKEKVEQLSDEAKDQVQTMRRRGMDYVDDTKNRVTRVASAVTQAAKETWEAEPTSGSPTGSTPRS